MTGTAMHGQEIPAHNSKLDPLSEVAPDIAPLIVSKEELSGILTRVGLTISALAYRLNYDPKTLVSKTSEIPILLSIVSDIRTNIGPEIFDEALKEVRSTQPVLSDDKITAPENVYRSKYYVTGEELKAIMSWEGITQKEVATATNRSTSLVSRYLWEYYKQPLPMTFAAKMIDRLGEARFNQLLAAIRSGYYERLVAQGQAASAGGRY